LADFTGLGGVIGRLRRILIITRMVHFTSPTVIVRFLAIRLGVRPGTGVGIGCGSIRLIVRIRAGTV